MATISSALVEAEAAKEGESDIGVVYLNGREQESKEEEDTKRERLLVDGSELKSNQGRESHQISHVEREEDQHEAQNWKQPLMYTLFGREWANLDKSKEIGAKTVPLSKKWPARLSAIMGIPPTHHLLKTLQALFGQQGLSLMIGYYPKWSNKWWVKVTLSQQRSTEWYLVESVTQACNTGRSFNLNDYARQKRCVFTLKLAPLTDAKRKPGKYLQKAPFTKSLYSSMNLASPLSATLVESSCKINPWQVKVYAAYYPLEDVWYYQGASFLAFRLDGVLNTEQYQFDFWM